MRSVAQRFGVRVERSALKILTLHDLDAWPVVACLFFRDIIRSWQKRRCCFTRSLTISNNVMFPVESKRLSASSRKCSLHHCHVSVGLVWCVVSMLMFMPQRISHSAYQWFILFAFLNFCWPFLFLLGHLFRFGMSALSMGKEKLYGTKQRHRLSYVCSSFPNFTPSFFSRRSMWLRCLDEFDMFISFVFKPGQLNIVDSLVTVKPALAFLLQVLMLFRGEFFAMKAIFSSLFGIYLEFDSLL
jgi:hypothetical protein